MIAFIASLFRRIFRRRPDRATMLATVRAGVRRAALMARGNFIKAFEHVPALGDPQTSVWVGAAWGEALRIWREAGYDLTRIRPEELRSLEDDFAMTFVSGG